MKKPSQSFQKRQREMAKKQKKEEKRQKKLEKKLLKEEAANPIETAEESDGLLQSD